jgi:cytochrome c oxidase cbb3-type subunit 4
MDNITTLRIVATLASFATFIGIWVWAYSRRNAQAFDEAARLPFDEDLS